MKHDQLFDLIADLVMCHSPSGAESEIDRFLVDKIERLNVDWEQDKAGNIVMRIAGRDSSRAIAITAHKDEIGGIVKSVHVDGRVDVRKLGGAYPWVYGEGVVDLLGDARVVSGILSFGSRHVSHESPQKVQQQDAPVLWENAWVETKKRFDDLVDAGVRPGTRMVVGKHRKRPFRMGQYIASYTLDNKASLAVLLGLAERIKSPETDVYLVASAKEEVGAIGAMYFSQTTSVEALIALEICPKSTEYPVYNDEAPVLLSQDGYGLYDEGLNRALAKSAGLVGQKVQHAVLSQFGSDGSIAMKMGHVATAACLSFPTDNTHGYEIADLRAIAACIPILEHYCSNTR